MGLEEQIKMLKNKDNQELKYEPFNVKDFLNEYLEQLSLYNYYIYRYNFIIEDIFLSIDEIEANNGNKVNYSEFFRRDKDVINVRVAAFNTYKKLSAMSKKLKSIKSKLLSDKFTKIENDITERLLLLDKGDPDGNKQHKKHFQSYQTHLDNISKLEKNIEKAYGILKPPDTIMATPVAQEAPQKAAHSKPPLNPSIRRRQYLTPTQQQAELINGIVPAVIKPKLNAQKANEYLPVELEKTPFEKMYPTSNSEPNASSIFVPKKPFGLSRGKSPAPPLSPPQSQEGHDIYPSRSDIPYRSPSARKHRVSASIRLKSALQFSADIVPLVAPRPPAAHQSAARRKEALKYAAEQPDSKSPVLNARRGSHSFNSNSPDNREEIVIDIVKDKSGPPYVYLIDNKDDGLCFLNAIFDYLLYSGKLPTMYERLLAIEDLILGQEKYKTVINILKIKKAALSLIGVREGTYDLYEKKLIPITQEYDKYYFNQKEQGQLILLTGIQKERAHPEYEDYTQLYYTDNERKVIHLGHPKGAHTKTIYEEQRKNFAKSMKYIVALYILSYGKRKFIENIMLVLINVRADATKDRNAFPNDWSDDGDDDKYDLKSKFEEGISNDNFDDFVYQYVFKYMKKNNFFANEILISMFNKILFKKIKDAKGENIPRFWLEVAKAKTGHGTQGIIPTEDKYLNLRGDRKFERVLNKYRFKTSAAEAPLNKYIHTNYKYDNYISLLCDEDRIHFLLFLLKEEATNYLVVDKPRGGAKPKRPKTAGKPKRAKTAK